MLNGHNTHWGWHDLIAVFLWRHLLPSLEILPLLCPFTFSHHYSHRFSQNCHNFSVSWKSQNSVQFAFFTFWVIHIWLFLKVLLPECLTEAWLPCCVPLGTEYVPCFSESAQPSSDCSTCFVARRNLVNVTGLRNFDSI